MTPVHVEAYNAPMDSARFEQLVIEALDSLPDEFSAYLENVEIIVARRPTREQRRMLGLKPWQSVYGMYHGVPLTERAGNSLVMPDTIVIFQEPLERDFRTIEALRAQVRRTVLHEIAHVFGISDDRLRELGAY
ncbi:MAG: metallopeptidase family protein [Oscillochloridaceae bacterium]|nr:metallopeptidase family protein [Chloroflexaceae bacterium]MDW8389279.1 metallopeptidase family protein [Oscillochloridaceae bacterium]